MRKHPKWIKEPIRTVAAILLLATTGCNAVKGLGKDLHNAAAYVQDVIEYEMDVQPHHQRW